MAKAQRARLAVDIGGTFTDIALERDGRVHTAKVLTTPAQPAEGFLGGIARVLAETGTAPREIGLILHGTTLATNALIERKGAKTALIVTEGHRDSLEMAYENRFAQYDLEAERPAPLVPRDLRWPVRERCDWRGGVLTPLDEASVEAWLPEIERQAIESLAVGLLHGYANPDHERRIAEIFEAAYPELPVTLASEVCPEVREYDRQSTTCANAYVRPLMARYLAEVAARLEAEGFACPCLVMTSGGNLVTLETAARFPIRLVESGPAGGAILACHIARSLGEDRVLSFDMGGTTAKICLIDEGQPQLSRSFEIDRAHRFMKGSGLPVKIPVVEMVEIGAGGGSMARVDALGRVAVGPESAGADPGPACYGRGGRSPTVTDADLLLGRLDPEGFAGGRMTLDAGAAAAALDRTVGEGLELDARAAAEAVTEIVDEAMASAARVHAVERGKEVAARTLIAFGGAAPLHAARLAEKLGIARVIVPADAGVGSAIGFLLAPIAYEVVRSRYTRLADFDPAALNALFAEMAIEAEAVVRLGAPAAPLEAERHAYVRYVGQGHEIKVTLPETELTAGDTETLRRAFEAAYEAQYGRRVPGLEIEVLTWSLTLSAPAPEVPVAAETPAASAAGTIARRRLRLLGGEEVEAAVHRRSDLAAGAEIAGPAVIVEDQTTTLVAPGYRAKVGDGGALVLERRREATASVSPALRRQVAWDRLISIVEEQAQALIRTAFSTTVREAGDLSAGIFDLEGRMLAQAVTGTPGHVNAMAASVGHFLRRFPPETMAPGDAYVTNDPWLGTGHLFDFTVVSPAFHGGRLVALFASTVHVVDIGGSGFGPDAGEVFEEGLCIPPLPLFRGGEAEDSLLEIIRANVREPDQVVGDLYSLAVSNEVGARRLAEMMAEFGLEDLDAVAAHILTASKDAMLAEIRALPAGRYENAMTVDGYDHPVTLTARMTLGDDGLEIDFAGSSPMSAFGVNVPLTYTQAYASFGVRCVLGSAIPNNAGSLAPIRVTAPEGSILNAPRPAAVNVRHVTGQMLPDVVLGCLEQALPGCAPAEGSSSLWNPMLSGGRGIVGEADYGAATPFSVTIFHSGGAGARPGGDGLSATAFPSGVRNTPVEITETVAPVLYHRKEYRPDSGGAGRRRGGLGQVIELGHAEGAPFAVFALFDRIVNPARGRHGGNAGAPGSIALADGTPLKSKGKQIVPAGQTLVLDLPGGGGYGPPAERGPERQEADLRQGLVTAEADQARKRA